MRKIFLIAFLLTSVAGLSQTAQFGDWYFRQRIGINKPTNNLHPNSVFEVNDSSIGSLFRIYKNGGIQSFKFKNNSAEDSILTTDQFGNFKLRLKPSTVLPWDSITGKPSLLISGNNLADVSNVATARTNLSVYSIATVNDSLLNHYTKSQADARFKSIDWFPSVANVTGLPDSLMNLQARIQTKLTKSDADTYYPSIQRMQDSLAAVQARVQTKEPFISPGTSAQYWRGDKSWQTLDKSAVGLSAVPNVDATNPANISQSATYRFVTDSEKSTWNAKQNSLGYTPENTANKATDFSTVNNTLYPTVQAVSNAITSATSSYIPLSQKGANNGVATLDVGGKVPFSQLPAALMIYKGTWNVSTNTPTLADGTGVTGWVYIVSVGGTVNTGSGNITYSAGDYAIHNGSTWEKSAGTNNVASVNGQQGVVNLTTANINELGNLYYTDSRARTALSFTQGSGTYNSLTGVITIPTNTNQLTNGAGFITGYTETDPTIYAWAKAATKPSYSWGEITGTVPTWNQNTTGNAATATTATNWSGSSSLGSYAYRSSGLAELSGANFTGSIFVNAENTYLAIDASSPRLGFVKKSGSQPFLAFSTDPFTIRVSGGSSVDPLNTFTTLLTMGTNGNINLVGTLNGTSLSFTGNGTFGTTTALTGIAGGIAVNSVSSSGMTMRLSDVNKGFVYVNGANVALEGASGMDVRMISQSGTFTLHSTGSVTASGDIRSNGIFRDNQGEALLQTSSNEMQLGSTGASFPRSFRLYTGNATAVTINTAQAANFSNSITSGGQISALYDGANVSAVTSVSSSDAVISARWTTGVGMNIRYNPNSAIGYIDNSYPVSANTNFGDIHFRQNVSSSLTTRMMLKGETGYLGLGTITPQSNLHIYNSGGNSDFRLHGFRSSNGVVGNILFTNMNDVSGGYTIASISSEREGFDNYGNIKFRTSGALALTISSNQTISAVNTITSTGFIKSGSSDSYFLLGGGGHVAASTYATTSSLSSYVNTTGNQLEIGGNKSFLGAVEVYSLKTTGGPGTPGVLRFGGKTNDTVFTAGSQYTLPVIIDGTTYYIRLWAGVN